MKDWLKWGLVGGVWGLITAFYGLLTEQSQCFFPNVFIASLDCFQPVLDYIPDAYPLVSIAIVFVLYFAVWFGVGYLVYQIINILKKR